MAVALAGSYASSSVATVQVPANGSAIIRQSSNVNIASFTAAVGDTIVVKASSGQPTTTVTGVSNFYGGSSAKGVVGTWTLAAYETAASGVAPIWIYIGTVTVAGAFNIEVDFATTASTNQVANFIVERFTGVVVPPTWNGGAFPVPDTASPFTATFTTLLNGSVITWMGADWNGRVTSYSGFTYQNGAVVTKYFMNSVAGGLDGYGAYQSAPTAGPTTIGFAKTPPSGTSSVNFAAVELPSVATPLPDVDDLMLAAA